MRTKAQNTSNKSYRRLSYPSYKRAYWTSYTWRKLLIVALIIWSIHERTAVNNTAFHPLSPYALFFAFLVFELIYIVIKCGSNELLFVKGSPLLEDSKFQSVIARYRYLFFVFIGLYIASHVQFYELTLSTQKSIISYPSLSAMPKIDPKVDYYQIDSVSPDLEVKSSVHQRIKRGSRGHKSVELTLQSAVRVRSKNPHFTPYLTYSAQSSYPQKKLFSTPKFAQITRGLKRHASQTYSDDQYLVCLSPLAAYHTSDYLPLIADRDQDQKSPPGPAFFMIAESSECSRSSEQMYLWQYLLAQVLEALTLIWLIRARERLQIEGDRVTLELNLYDES